MKTRLAPESRPRTITSMDTLSINISWEFFLGLIGSLIAIAYYANGRFTGLETDVQWLKEMMSELLISAENIGTKVYKSGSPVSLTATGYHILQRSGLKSYVDAKRHTLLSALYGKTTPDPYELQRRAFRLLAGLNFDAAVAHHINNFAFANGISTDLLRRVAAIYLRDIASQSI